MKDTDNGTERLIESLTGELEPVNCMKHPCIRTLYWVLFAGVYALLVVFFLGFRSDLIEKLQDPVYLFEIFLVFAMSMSAVMSSHWLCVPDMRGQHWMPVVSLTLFTVLLSWMILHFFTEVDYFEHMYFSYCMFHSVIFGVIPATAIVLLSMKGKTTCPLLMVLMNSIAVGGIGYIGLRLICDCDDMTHIVFHHVMPYLFLGGVIAALGQKFYRW